MVEAERAIGGNVNVSFVNYFYNGGDWCQIIIKTKIEKTFNETLISPKY
jgi:hypothetical protein